MIRCRSDQIFDECEKNIQVLLTCFLAKINKLHGD